MMGQNNFQRSALTVNHGKYYVNTTVSKNSQQNAVPPFQSFNVFVGGNVYDLFFLFTQPDTQQTYQLFVGKNLPHTVAQTNVVYGYEGLTLPFNFTPASTNDAKSGAWDSKYDPSSGILTLKTNLSQIAANYSLNAPVADAGVSLGQRYCQPATMCSWNSDRRSLSVQSERALCQLVQSNESRGSDDLRLVGSAGPSQLFESERLPAAVYRLSGAGLSGFPDHLSRRMRFKREQER